MAIKICSGEKHQPRVKIFRTERAITPTKIDLHSHFAPDQILIFAIFQNKNLFAILLED
jgi:hypothetical protein